MRDFSARRHIFYIFLGGHNVVEGRVPLPLSITITSTNISKSGIKFATIQPLLPLKMNPGHATGQRDTTGILYTGVGLSLSILNSVRRLLNKKSPCFVAL